MLHAASAKVSEDFYCRKLGFTLSFAYRFDDARPDPCYMGFERDEVKIHVSSFSGDAVPGGVIFFYVDNVDELYRQFTAEGVVITLPPTDQSWGSREMYINDPDGNDLPLRSAAASLRRRSRKGNRSIPLPVLTA